MRVISPGFFRLIWNFIEIDYIFDIVSTNTIKIILSITYKTNKLEGQQIYIRNFIHNNQMKEIGQ